jgi:hypothetical protein
MLDVGVHSEADHAHELSIDDDVLTAARDLAERERKTVGEVLSCLARRGFSRAEPAGGVRNGVPLLPRRGSSQSVTLELVSRLRDEAP